MVASDQALTVKARHVCRLGTYGCDWMGLVAANLLSRRDGVNATAQHFAVHRSELGANY